MWRRENDIRWIFTSCKKIVLQRRLKRSILLSTMYNNFILNIAPASLVYPHNFFCTSCSWYIFRDFKLFFTLIQTKCGTYLNSYVKNSDLQRTEAATSPFGESWFIVAWAPPVPHCSLRTTCNGHPFASSLGPFLVPFQPVAMNLLSLAFEEWEQQIDALHWSGVWLSAMPSACFRSRRCRTEPRARLRKSVCW